MATLQQQLKEKQDEIAAKQSKIHEVFEAAGESVDFATDKVLALAGVKSSAEVVQKVREWNTELADLGRKRDELAELARIQDEVKRRKQTPVNAPPMPGAAEEGAGAEKKAVSFGAAIVSSDAFAKFTASKSPSETIVKDFGLAELKTAFSTGAGWAPQSIRVPGLVIPFATRPVQLLDVIPTGATQMASVVYMEETTFTNNAAERSEAASYAESAFALTEKSVTVRSIGNSVPVTDEQLEDVPQAQSYLDQRLQYGVRQRLDGQLLTGDGNAPNLTGLLNVSGIQTQAKNTDPAPDAIYKAMTNVRVTGRAFPSHVVAHPTDWQNIRLLKTADGIYIWGSPAAADPDRIWGVQVVICDASSAGTAVVADLTNFTQLYERRGMEVAVGYVNDDFLKGKRTIRAGLRVAFVVYRPKAICTVTGL